MPWYGGYSLNLGRGDFVVAHRMMVTPAAVHDSASNGVPDEFCACGGRID